MCFIPQPTPLNQLNHLKHIPQRQKQSQLIEIDQGSVNSHFSTKRLNLS